MNYTQNDGGRAISKRPQQKQDCVVRAISIVSRAAYDDIYDWLAAAGRRCGRSTPKSVWQGQLNTCAKFVRQAFPAEAGKPRMTLEKFCAATVEGRYVVQCAGHLTAVINGTVHDDFLPRANACVYAVWFFVERP